MRETLKVAVSGVRGVVGESLTPQVAAAFAQAFGALVGRGPVLVGRDTRPSGVVLEEAVRAGLQSVGCRPLLAGVSPTPTLLMRTPALQARGAIAITASHNPAEWNALKFADRRGLFLGAARAEDLFDLYHQQDFPFVPEAEIPAARATEDGFAEHAERSLACVDAGRIRARRFRVALDPVNGVGARFGEPFLRDGLGCETVVVHGRPDGVFERNPEPLPEALGRLRRAVLERRCDVGFAQDPDGDRLTVLDAKGRALGEDFSLAFAVRQTLRSRRGPVVVNLVTSRVIEAIARSAGCEVLRTPVGEIHVVEAMLRVRAAVGGENVGGVIRPDVHPCRDSFTAIALILDLMAETGRSIEELAAQLPPAFIARRKIRAPNVARISEALRGLRRQFDARKVTLQDGILVDHGDRWVHARRSNTEPVLRVTAEAADPAGAAELADDLTRRLGLLLEEAGSRAPFRAPG